MKFFYREIEVFPSPASRKKKKVLRPIIPVILVYGNKMVGYEALIDSGADYSVFDAGIAEVLGIKISSGHKRQIAGIGGQKIKGYAHTVALKIADKRYETQVIFSKEIPPHSFGVLGNQGFFDHFKISFDYRKKVIVLI